MSRKQAIASMKKHNMDVSFLKEGINWKKFNSMVQDAIEYEYEWDYVESEGENGVRFDWSKGSMWVHPPADLLGDKIPASATGQIPPDKDVKKALKKLKINTRQIPSRTGYKK